MIKFLPEPEVRLTPFPPTRAEVSETAPPTVVALIPEFAPEVTDEIPPPEPAELISTVLSTVEGTIEMLAPATNLTATKSMSFCVVTSIPDPIVDDTAAI